MAGFWKELSEVCKDLFVVSGSENKNIDEYVKEGVISSEVAKELIASQKRANSIKAVSHRKQNTEIHEVKTREENGNTGRQPQHPEREDRI